MSGVKYEEQRSIRGLRAKERRTNSGEATSDFKAKLLTCWAPSSSPEANKRNKN